MRSTYLKVGSPPPYCNTLEALTAFPVTLGQCNNLPDMISPSSPSHALSAPISGYPRLPLTRLGPFITTGPTQPCRILSRPRNISYGMVRPGPMPPVSATMV